MEVRPVIKLKMLKYIKLKKNNSFILIKNNIFIIFIILNVKINILYSLYI